MSEVAKQVRIIEPFGFWPQYSSALRGFGGEEGGPDPYYCFHTPYLEYQTGGLIFRMRLIGATATMGELALRVHAWRRDGSMDAVLVGGLRIPLDGLDGDYEYTVRVASLPDVSYAFLARYTQPSDLQINDLVLSAEELADEDVGTYGTVDLTRSKFAPTNLPAPSHLTILGEPTLAAPLSQPCTEAQLAELETLPDLPPEVLEIDDAHERWRTAFAWQALTRYGVAEPGALGCVFAASSPLLAQLLQRRGALVAEAAQYDTPATHDFVVDMEGIDDVTDSKELVNRVMSRMTWLMRGGVGVFVFTVRLGGIASTAPETLGEEWLPGEQDIQRVALKIIGHSSDIAQIVWPKDRDHLQTAPFGLVVRR